MRVNSEHKTWESSICFFAVTAKAMTTKLFSEEPVEINSTSSLKRDMTFRPSSAWRSNFTVAILPGAFLRTRYHLLSRRKIENSQQHQPINSAIIASGSQKALTV